MQRRNFLKNTLAASTALAIPGTAIASVDNWAKLDQPKTITVYPPDDPNKHKYGPPTELIIPDKDYWFDNAIEIMSMLIKDTEKDPPNGSFQIGYFFNDNNKNQIVTYDINDMSWKLTILDDPTYNGQHGNKNYIDGLKREINYCKWLKNYKHVTISQIELSFPTFSRFLWDDYYQMNKTFSSGYYARQENPNELDELFNKYNIYYQQPRSDELYSYVMFDFPTFLKKIKCPEYYFYNEKENLLLVKNADDPIYLALRGSELLFLDVRIEQLRLHLERIHNYKKHLLGAYKNNLITLDTALYYAFNHKLGWQHHDMQKGYIS